MNQKKILLVDDQNTVLMLEKMMLKDAGYQIVTARNGEEAVERATSERPDLIVMDVMMPKMDGYAACRALRAQEATQKTPIIMVTTKGEVAQIQTGFDAGCSDYVTKPFNAVALLSKIKRFLSE